jgi:hypothetical protein
MTEGNRGETLLKAAVKKSCAAIRARRRRALSIFADTGIPRRSSAGLWKRTRKAASNVRLAYFREAVIVRRMKWDLKL